MADYYSLLGVSKACSDIDLKKAYRRLAKKYHPDVNKEPGSEEKFKEIQKAYEVLKNKENKALYDNYGDAWDKVQQGGAGAQGGFSGQSSQSFNFEDLGSVFGDLFGGRSGGFGGEQARAKKGEDITVLLRLNVEEAIKGGKRTVSYKYQETGFGGMPRMQSKSVDVNIPEAIGNGKKLRLRGRGSEGTGADATDGDLYIKIEIIEHQNYKLDGNDIFEHVSITPWEAALGTVLELTTPFGKKKMKVPEGTQSGRKMRIKGKGLAGGDFYIVYDVKLPLADTQERKDFYNQMKKLMDFNPRS